MSRSLGFLGQSFWLFNMGGDSGARLRQIVSGPGIIVNIPYGFDLYRPAPPATFLGASTAYVRRLSSSDVLDLSVCVMEALSPPTRLHTGGDRALVGSGNRIYRSRLDIGIVFGRNLVDYEMPKVSPHQQALVNVQ